MKPRPITAAERHDLEYIRDLVQELALVARAGRLDFVEYLLDMTYLETCDLLREERKVETALPLLN